jgi:hypothetical protein
MGLMDKAKSEAVRKANKAQKVVAPQESETSEIGERVSDSGPSLATELERLAALHRDGSLTDDEFQAAKSRLLEVT